MGLSSRIVVLSALVGVGCSFNPPPAPIVGGNEERAALVGVWSGDYWSADSGRSGQIYFRLTERADRAYGGVIMIPASAPDHVHPRGRHPDSEYLYVSFIRVIGKQVQGRLDRYRDPACGCRVETRFYGTLVGDTISGTFTTVQLSDGMIQRGRWSASRGGPEARQGGAIHTRGVI